MVCDGCRHALESARALCDRSRDMLGVLVAVMELKYEY